MDHRLKHARVKLMEVCGTHTVAIARAGIKKLLPPSVELVSGPGCPVCVTASQDIDRAMAIARLKGVIMTTFGDMMRVPGATGSFQDLKKEGCDIRVVYSCLEALDIARRYPEASVVFMGVGFETTSPTVAATVQEAARTGVKNFFVLSYFKRIFPALESLARSRTLAIDGFLCPGHVSVITGSRPYERLSREYRKPCVITGFEPADILAGIRELLRQIKEREYSVAIAYRRAVRPAGNPEARRMLDSVFQSCSAAWRGLGRIPASGLVLRRKYGRFDALRKFHVKVPRSRVLKGCRCAEILQGNKAPQDCRLFTKACTPQHPVGPCMVSSEGACAAAYHYGERHGFSR